MKTDTTTKLLLGTVILILIILVVLVVTKRKNVDPIIIESTPINQQATNQSTLSGQQQAPSQSPAPIPQPQGGSGSSSGVATSHGSTFTGPNGEYSFKLPSGWNAIQAPQSTAVLFGANTTTENADGSMVIFRNQPSAAAVMQFLAENFGATFSNEQPRTINGASAISATMKAEGGFEAPFVAIYKNGTVFVFSLTKNDSIMFEALISTFKINSLN